jgi:F0F1-type ATP synthase membrane subunit b/b'
MDNDTTIAAAIDERIDRISNEVARITEMVAQISATLEKMLAQRAEG